MYRTCPVCGHQHDAEIKAASCAACGLVFEKYLKNIAVDTELAGAQQPREPTPGRRLTEYLFVVRPGITRGDVLLYGVVWLVALVWGLDFLSMDYRSAAIMNTWFHNIDLVIHEAGHVLFMPFGRSMMLLGGSLFQVLLPLIFMFAFLIINRDSFAASICLWWAGQSMMDVAPYIADATKLRLPLLGGGTGMDSPGRHDWANLLRPRGWLQYDQQIAAWTDAIGSGLLILALAWGAYMLLVYFRHTRQ